MTFATVLTIIRLILVPVFAWSALNYGASVDQGHPVETYRWSAVAIYTLASILDGLDGWIARRFNQQSLLGAALDPVADKILLMTGLFMATFVNWGVDWHLPIWFILLVIARDLEIFIGLAILYKKNGRVPIIPHKIGKICTVTQMIAMGWIMLKVTSIDPIYPTLLATFFTLWSAYLYYLQGYRQLPSQRDRHPSRPPPQS